MATIRANSPDGVRHVTLSVHAQEGPFSVARGVDFSQGKNGELRRVWVIYHTKIGCAFPGDWTTLEAATEAMHLFTKIVGNWDRPFTEINADPVLRQRFKEVYMAIRASDLGTLLAIEEDE